MNADKFIKSREVLVNEKTFIVSKIPAMDAIPIYNEVAKSVAENGILGITMLWFYTTTSKLLLLNDTSQGSKRITMQ